MKAIVNGTLVMYDHIIPDGFLLIDGDTIVDYGKARDMEHGVTSVLPALYMSLNKKGYLDAIDNILNAKDQGKFSKLFRLLYGRSVS